MFCTKCGTEANTDGGFCANCGAPTGSAPPPLDNHNGATAADITKQLYAAAIGPKNTDYYLKYFAKADAAGKALLSWHWPSFFFNFYWMLYRKLWVPAAIYFFAPALTVVLVALLALALGLGAGATAALIFLTSFTFAWLMPAMFANRWYYNRCKQLVDQAQRTHNSVDDRLTWLALKGGTSRAGIWIFAVISLIGVLAAIAIPAYQDYTIRGQVTEGMNLAGPAKAAITETYTKTGIWPKDNAAAGQPEEISGEYVESVQVVGSGLIITFKDAEPVSRQLRGKDLYMVAGLAPNGDVAWQCGSKAMAAGIEPAQFDFETAGAGGSVAQKFRPAECRG